MTTKIVTKHDVELSTSRDEKHWLGTKSLKRLKRNASRSRRAFYKENLRREIMEVTYA